MSRFWTLLLSTGYAISVSARASIRGRVLLVIGSSHRIGSLLEMVMTAATPKTVIARRLIFSRHWPSLIQLIKSGNAADQSPLVGSATWSVCRVT